MRPTPESRHGLAIARRADAPPPAIPVGVLGAVVLLMLAWGGIIAIGLGLH